MSVGEKLYRLYYLLPDFSRFGKPGRVIDKILAFILKRILDATLPSYYLKTQRLHTLAEGENRKKKIVCSLTSFPARIDQVWIAIESLMHQTVKPDKIILWLSSEQFSDHVVPDSLQKMTSRGLQIEFCSDDLKAHKKYIYALTRYPNDWIITFDDDLYHERHAIENLLNIKEKFHDTIVTNRAHQIRVSADGKLQPYKKWDHNIVKEQPSKQNVATGGCGALYQVDLLHLDFSNEEKIKRLSFFADDLWLKIMAHLRGTRVVTNKRYGKDPIVIGKTQTVKLVTTNVLDGGNDQQLRSLIEHYKVNVSSFID